jgi:hypothetical protein
MSHTFHIPVLGLGYSIDTPLKVAKFGISSVVSIVDDELTERMRKHHMLANGMEYQPIGIKEVDSRAKRITAYLNLLDDLVKKQMDEMKKMDFISGNDLYQYFEMLPAGLNLKTSFYNMLSLQDGAIKNVIKEVLKNEIKPGSIDVNIMSKVDKANYNADDTYAGDDFTDAIAAMRGFAESKLHSAVIISAGLNPRLYAYMENCADFYFESAKSDEKVASCVSAAEAVCHPRRFKPLKSIILKVSDYRSAIIQAKMLAKKGLWVTEFRVESGLNCGGHAFATDGLLMGPILEEFKLNRQSLKDEIWKIYSAALLAKGRALPAETPEQGITYQGGIGTAEEHQFLIKNYELDAAGWGSPFLLVPQATNVDNATLEALVTAEEKDFYISNASPLGVLFNNFRPSSAENLRLERIEKGRPGSPCKKKYLCTNTEFTEKPICTASREYQHLKIEQLKTMGLPETAFQTQFNAITEKVCLCEGLCASVYLKNAMLNLKENDAVSICPGPNLAYFSGKYSLKEMIQHIYGEVDLLTNVNRPNLFVNELRLYIDYLKKDMESHIEAINDKKTKYWNKFSLQLQQGISYYRNVLPGLIEGKKELAKNMEQQINDAENALNALTKSYCCC